MQQVIDIWDFMHGIIHGRKENNMKKINWSKWKDSNITDEQWIQLREEPCIDNYLDISDEEFRVLSLEELKEEEHQLELLKEYLYDLGVRQLPTDLTLDEIKEKWKAAFCGNMSKKEMKKIHIDRYLWHLFSYEKVTDILLKDEAKRQFECADKSDIYIFNQHDGPVCRISVPSTLKCYMLRLLYFEDYYFVDADFTWTFVLPHDYDILWYSLK